MGHTLGEKMVLESREELLAKLYKVASRKGLLGWLPLRCLKIKVLLLRLKALETK